MAQIFDAHAHYDDDAFDTDREELLLSLKEKNVDKIVNAGVDIKTSNWGIEYANKYDFFYTTVGIHPQNITNLESNYIDVLDSLLKEKKVVAIGEIGLDYYWKPVLKEEQHKVFTNQLALANDTNMPVVVHDREAHGDTLELLKKYKPTGLVHCFSGSVEMCKEIVKLGMSISLGGVVTFKNARHSVDVAREIPIDRLLLETDAPYLSPIPFRGKRCDSSMIIHTAKRIAEIRGMNIDELLKITHENACRLYSINNT